LGSEGKIELEQVFEQEAAHVCLSECGSEVMENRELVIDPAHPLVRRRAVFCIV
jgi:hypothetical protein